MRFIFISPGLPKENGKGYEKIFHERLFLLPKGSNVLIIICRSWTDPTIEERISTYQHLNIKLIFPKFTLYDYINFLPKFLLGDPIQLLLHHRYAVEKILKNVYSTSPNTRIYCLMSRAIHSNIFLFHYNIVDFVDSMELNFERRAAKEKNILKSFIYRLEATRMRDWDKKYAAIANDVLVVNELDAKYISQKKSKVIPIGIQSANILTKALSGNMNYAPNIEAVEYFVEFCLKELRTLDNSVEFHIVGRGLTQKIEQRLKSEPGVKIIGEVSDMLETLSKYPISIAPMQSGSGMQFKVIEALSVGCIVVSSEIAASTIKNEKTNALVIANTSANYVHIIDQIMTNLNDWQFVANETRDYIEMFYGWDKAADILSETEWFKI